MLEISKHQYKNVNVHNLEEKGKKQICKLKDVKVQSRHVIPTLFSLK